MGPYDPDVVVPDVVGEVVAWRAWNIVGTLGIPRLQSVTHSKSKTDSIWPTQRWFEAECSKGHRQGEIPVITCSCGLYAAKDRDQLVKLAYGAYGNRDVKAIGRVGFVGKLVEGPQGWRAAKGRIISLIVPYEFWQWVDPLAEAYNVPVELGFLFSQQARTQALVKERSDAMKELLRDSARAEAEAQRLRMEAEQEELRRDRDEYERRRGGGDR